MKKLISTIYITLAAITLYGQGSTSAQYMLNPMSVNPGFTGYYNALSAAAQFRFQTIGVDGAPVTQTIGIHSPLRTGHAAVGLQLWNESKAVFKQTGAFASYAYKVNMNGINISAGLQGGFNMNESNFTSISTRQASDPAFNDNLRTIKPSVGFGLFVYHQKFSAGIALPELLDSNDDESLANNRPLILTGGYIFEINDRWKIKPNALMRMVEFRPVEINLNANAVYMDVLSAGFSYGFNNVAVGLLQVFVTDQLQLGYTFETVLGDAASISAGTHEIGIQYLFNHSRKNSPSPRYF